MLLLNAFSFNMVSVDVGNIRFDELSVGQAITLCHELSITSGVGHADTAAVFGQQLGIDVPMARISVSLEYGDCALVGQYSGPRLPEGATALPDGAAIRWLFVRVQR